MANSESEALCLEGTISVLDDQITVFHQIAQEGHQKNPQLSVLVNNIKSVLDCAHNVIKDGGSKGDEYKKKLSIILDAVEHQLMGFKHLQDNLHIRVLCKNIGLIIKNRRDNAKKFYGGHKSSHLTGVKEVNESVASASVNPVTENNMQPLISDDDSSLALCKNVPLACPDEVVTNSASTSEQRPVTTNCNNPKPLHNLEVAKIYSLMCQQDQQLIVSNTQSTQLQNGYVGPRQHGFVQFAYSNTVVVNNGKEGQNVHSDEKFATCSTVTSVVPAAATESQVKNNLAPPPPDDDDSDSSFDELPPGPGILKPLKGHLYRDLKLTVEDHLTNNVQKLVLSVLREEGHDDVIMEPVVNDPKIIKEVENMLREEINALLENESHVRRIQLSGIISRNTNFSFGTKKISELDFDTMVCVLKYRPISPSSVPWYPFEPQVTADLTKKIAAVALAQPFPKATETDKVPVREGLTEAATATSLKEPSNSNNVNPPASNLPYNFDMIPDELMKEHLRTEAALAEAQHSLLPPPMIPSVSGSHQTCNNIVRPGGSDPAAAKRLAFFEALCERMEEKYGNRRKLYYKYHAYQPTTHTSN